MKNIKLKDIMNEGSIPMKFTQEQLEIIAYFVSLGESDINNPPVRKDAQKILGALQRKGIYGHIDLD